MKKPKTRIIFSIVFILSFFSTVPHASGQQTIDYYTLQYFKQSLEYLIGGDYDNAILFCSRVLGRDSDSVVTYTIRARAYFEKGDYKNAIADCNQAIRRDRNNLSAYFIRGNSYAKTGDMKRAVADWESVLKINPENADAMQNIELANKEH